MRAGNRIVSIGLILGAALLLRSVPAGATSIQRQNLVDLIQLSETILSGRVVGLTDGFQNGVPYTEVVIAVDETIRGKPGGTYTFRQFGLLAPRDLGGGRRYLGVSPDGWPRFAMGEDVVLFLYKKGAKTGFRTTVGLLQGTFRKTGNHLENGADNIGLMNGVSAAPGLLGPREQKLLSLKKGPVDADLFLSLVRKAVQERWIENGKLHRVR